ncbi:MAG TPA: hypothetical protein VG147_04290 [Solirubrobacteraceae bacterium]|jgi:hypothetical protein|nr:hypothetical protein [Solirubrobacteraceae bacterium]
MLSDRKEWPIDLIPVIDRAIFLLLHLPKKVKPGGKANRAAGDTDW